MAKKGFLQKLGLVENQEEVNVNDLLSQFNNVTADELDIPEDLALKEVISIEDVYSQFNLTDLSKSIFKVEEFSSVLPKELSTDARRASVIGILNASGLNVDSLIDDAKFRVDALNKIKLSFFNETNDIVNDCQNEISLLEEQIDKLKDTINLRKKNQESQDEIISNEIKEIEKIVKFINPIV